MSFTLTYVLTTFNKYDYLKVVLEHLLNHLKQDEEVIVIDGGSKDNTPSYLESLYKAGKIHCFLSEKDKGESHGFNKGFLLAKGDLIKVITDDDVFDYDQIAECKKFMLNNPQVDVLSANTIQTYAEDHTNYSLFKECEENFLKFKTTKQPVSFIGLPLMIRKSALALTGLFNIGVKYPDTDFSLKITSQDLNIAWYRPVIVTRIDNYHSNFRNIPYSQRMDSYEKLHFFYDKDFRKHYIPYKAKEFLKGPYRRIKGLIKPSKENKLEKTTYDFKKIHAYAIELMKTYNKEHTYQETFILAGANFK